MFDIYDRTVHATVPGSGEIVRYDKASKWYLEYPPKTLKPRTKLSLAGAVDLALKHEREPGCCIFLNRAGGTMFDARVRKLKIIKSKAVRNRAANPLKVAPAPTDEDLKP